MERICKPQDSELHSAYAKCFHQAKQTVYWPGCYDDSQVHVRNGQVCLKYSKYCKKPTSQGINQEVPFIPWRKLAANLFHFENSTYRELLLQVDR